MGMVLNEIDKTVLVETIVLFTYDSIHNLDAIGKWIGELFLSNPDMSLSIWNYFMVEHLTNMSL